MIALVNLLQQSPYIKALREYCAADKDDLFAAAGGYVSADKRYAYLDRGADILAVAHCDTVNDAFHFERVNLGGDDLIFSPKLDDRLGVFTILEVLPALGINVDVLLTDDEEMMQSTAALFETKKKYNWIVEFDRRGDDVVAYDYEDKDWCAALRGYFTVGMGSLSDICYLAHIGCKAVNVGVGYHEEHSRYAYMNIAEYHEQLFKFRKFYNMYHRCYFAHIPEPAWEDSWLGISGGAAWELDEDKYEKILCPHCEQSFYECEQILQMYGYSCPYCGENLAELFEKPAYLDSAYTKTQLSLDHFVF